MMTTINQQKFIVTGGTGGTGSAVSRKLKQAGAHVVIWGRNEQRLAAAVTEGQAQGSFAADLGQPEAVEQAFADYDQRFGALHGFVHCAGVWTPGELKEVEPQVIVQHLAAVASSALLCARSAARRMSSQAGRIIMVAAASAKPGFADTTLNVAAKRAVDGLNEGLIRELKDTACQVTTLYPDSIAAAGSDSVTQGAAMSYEDLAELVLFSATAPPTLHLQEIVVTARNTGR